MQKAQNENKKILLHACCGICSGYPISLLIDLEYSPIVYFCNPNLDTKKEYERRLNAQQQVCNFYGIELIAEDYEHNIFLDYINGLENEPERGKRCAKCIELRLNFAAKKAKELDINTFTTSLVISPHKNFDMISSIGNKIAEQYDLEYLSINFRKQDGFLKTNEISKKLNIYRQNYCGCEFAKSHIK